MAGLLSQLVAFVRKNLYVLLVGTLALYYVYYSQGKSGMRQITYAAEEKAAEKAEKAHKALAAAMAEATAATAAAHATAWGVKQRKIHKGHSWTQLDEV